MVLLNLSKTNRILMPAIHVVIAVFYYCALKINLVFPLVLFIYEEKIQLYST